MPRPALENARQSGIWSFLTQALYTAIGLISSVSVTSGRACLLFQSTSTPSHKFCGVDLGRSRSLYAHFNVLKLQ
eukprot:1771742-Pleurochrysis_carterae.AAC.3